MSIILRFYHSVTLKPLHNQDNLHNAAVKAGNDTF